MSKWVQIYEVPASKMGNFWTVAIDRDGNYGCSCPVWKFRRLECKHIIQIKEKLKRNKSLENHLIDFKNKILEELNEEL